MSLPFCTLYFTAPSLLNFHTGKFCRYGDDGVIFSSLKSRTYRFKFVLLLMIWGSAAGSLCAQDAHAVTVRLKDGTIRTGLIHPKTDSKVLWLHTAERSIYVETSVSWSQVESVQTNNKPSSLPSVIQQAGSQLSVYPAVPELSQACCSVEAPIDSNVSRLELFASVANWKNNSVSDGVQFRLNPMNFDGDTIPVDGMLTVRLIGRRHGTRDIRTSPLRFGFWTDGSAISEYLPLHDNQRYVEVGRWTERVRADLFTSQGYVARLPFRSVHPERDTDLDIDAMIECRFNMSARPVLYAFTPIQLRTYNPVRDALQIERQTRLFPDEVTASP